VEIFVWAEYVDQDLATPQNIALVREMLEKYATVKVTASTGNVIYQGAVWGNYPNAPVGNNSMRDKISLGQFAPGVEKDLLVELKLSPELDNLYQDLWGKIKWVFCAQGDDPVSPTPYGEPMPTPTLRPPTPKPTGYIAPYRPNTGEGVDRLMLTLGLILVISGAAIIVILRTKTKEEAEG